MARSKASRQKAYELQNERRAAHRLLHPRQGKCYNCWRRGHSAENCDLPIQIQRCHFCGQPGHFRRDCEESTSTSTCYMSLGTRATCFESMIHGFEPMIHYNGLAGGVIFGIRLRTHDSLIRTHDSLQRVSGWCDIRNTASNP